MTTPYQQIWQQIAQAAADCGRAVGEVTLIAVSKGQERAAIETLWQEGQRDFGENRLEEAEAKYTASLPSPDGSRPNLHLIGALQSRKVARAVALFDCIHSLDRPKLARKLVSEMQAQQRFLPCFIQVNTGNEPQKSGCSVAALPDFIRLCREELGLEITGLMGLPPATEDPAPHFALLAELAARHSLPHLSMGMSGDFETAIRHGATHLRIGTALFASKQEGT